MKTFCKYRLLIILSFLWGLQPVFGQRTADSYFIPAAKSYVKSQTAEARQQVDEGLKAFPDDIRLQKLDDLLRRQQQQQNDNSQQDDKQKKEKQQQQQDQQKQDQQKQDQQQQQDQQKKEEQEKQQKEAEEKKKQQEQQQQEQQKKEQEQAKSQEQQKQDQQGDDQKDKQQASMARAIPMTPQEAQRLLDSLKHEEKAMIFIPQIRTNRTDRVLKDW